MIRLQLLAVLALAAIPARADWITIDNSETFEFTSAYNGQPLSWPSANYYDAEIGEWSPVIGSTVGMVFSDLAGNPLAGGGAMPVDSRPGLNFISVELPTEDISATNYLLQIQVSGPPLTVYLDTWKYGYDVRSVDPAPSVQLSSRVAQFPDSTSSVPETSTVALIIIGTLWYGACLYAAKRRHSIMDSLRAVK